MTVYARDTDIGDDVRLRWYVEPARKRRVLVGFSRFNLVECNAPNLAFAEVWHKDAPYSLLVFVIEDAATFRPDTVLFDTGPSMTNRHIFGDLGAGMLNKFSGVCLGSARNDFHRGRISGPEAFWMSSFSSAPWTKGETARRHEFTRRRKFLPDNTGSTVKDFENYLRDNPRYRGFAVHAS